MLQTGGINELGRWSVKELGGRDFTCVAVVHILIHRSSYDAVPDVVTQDLTS